MGREQHERIGAGWDADVYALGPERVLRRYRRGGDVAHEAQVMRHVAAHGYPVPVVSRAEGPDLEMDRLSGPTMLAALVADEIGMDEAAEVLADLQHRLHALPSLSGADTSVVHMDLHPGNVMLTPRGPVVIDWRDAREGTAELDLAMTSVVLGSVARSGSFADQADAAAGFIEVFVPLVAEQVLVALDEAVQIRLENPGLDESGREDVRQAAQELNRLCTGGRSFRRA
ncbi:phosphotransferase [Kineosporia babensis]|uniref:Phosphotransferase n=1 Tax=Kineosporia babensis TaxID=499548 RepID=A0A9X1NHB9_9ACTN|nr:phosphotransferase [Kineosporia babensis]MCD5315052.1 phosphotransferase [Kineosporia babensis]